MKIDIPGLPIPFARSGGHGKRVPDQALIDSYKRTKSVWRTGKEVGLCGQSVHERLKRLGLSNPVRIITEEEQARIREYYSITPVELFDLNALAASMKRPKTTICREAQRFGLTDMTRKKSSAAAIKTKQVAQGRWNRHPHPKGMLGKNHSAEMRSKMGERVRRDWATAKTFGIGLMSEEARARRAEVFRKTRAQMNPENAYSRCRSGRRADLGSIFFRSAWEANYARYLNLLLKMKAIEGWEYEPETFWFKDIKRGVLSYKPDFRIKHKNDDRLEYIELKGWETAKDRTKWKRMKKYHPHIKLTIIKAKGYRVIARKWASAIPQWEVDKRDKYR